MLRNRYNNAEFFLMEDLNPVMQRNLRHLGFKGKRDEIPINGINSTSSAATHSVSVRFSSKDGSYSNVIKCYILPTLTGNMPSPVNPNKLKMARDIQIADKQFYLPRKVEMIIGADLYPYLIRPGQVISSDDHPVLQETSLRWILLGRLPEAEACHHTTVMHMSNTQDVEAQLQKFLEQEEVNVVHHTNEERAAEDHFIRTTIRDYTRRFIVRLPHLPNHAPLGDSYKNTQQRFLQLEKKLLKNGQLCEDYINFIKEYLQLGHMASSLQ
jgi:hypothetical protein